MKYILYLFIYGNLDCYHILDVVINGAMNIGVHIYFELVFSFSSEKYPELELLNHMVILLTIFEETL